MEVAFFRFAPKTRGLDVSVSASRWATIKLARNSANRAIPVRDANATTDRPRPRTHAPMVIACRLIRALTAKFRRISEKKTISSVNRVQEILERRHVAREGCSLQINQNPRLPQSRRVPPVSNRPRGSPPSRFCRPPCPHARLPGIATHHRRRRRYGINALTNDSREIVARRENR